MLGSKAICLTTVFSSLINALNQIRFHKQRSDFTKLNSASAARAASAIVFFKLKLADKHGVLEQRK